jgi:hypothetical protein
MFAFPAREREHTTISRPSRIRISFTRNEGRAKICAIALPFAAFQAREKADNSCAVKPDNSKKS